MKRVTMSLDEDLAEQFEALIADRGYLNRSEAFRDLLRHDLSRQRLREDPTLACVAALSYVYSHHERQLALRMADVQHDHHALVVATTHVHLSHEHCIEVVLLRGPACAVRRFAESVIAQSGVSHGQLNLIVIDAVPA